LRWAFPAGKARQPERAATRTRGNPNARWWRKCELVGRDAGPGRIDEGNGVSERTLRRMRLKAARAAESAAEATAMQHEHDMAACEGVEGATADAANEGKEVCGEMLT